MEFPALWIAREGTFGVVDEPFTAGSYVAYRNGFFTGLSFFDSSGERWDVTQAVPVRTVTALDRLLNRRVELNMQYASPAQPSLADVVDRLCYCVDNDPDDLYEQFLSRGELKRFFRASRTPADLIQRARTLGADGSWQDRDVS